MLTCGPVSLQVNLCQKRWFLHQLTHNMTTDCSLNYKFNTWEFQAQTWGEHVVYRNCLGHSEQFLYTTCSPQVLKKGELLRKIYLYFDVICWKKCTFQLPFIRFELNEAIFLPIEENRSVTASASYSVLINRTKERSAVKL